MGIDCFELNCHTAWKKRWGWRRIRLCMGDYMDSSCIIAWPNWHHAYFSVPAWVVGRSCDDLISRSHVSLTIYNWFVYSLLASDIKHTSAHTVKLFDRVYESGVNVRWTLYIQQIHYTKLTSSEIIAFFQIFSYYWDLLLSCNVVSR